MEIERKTKLLEEAPGELSVMRTIMVAVAGTVLGMFVVSNLTILANALIRGGKIELVDIPANMMAIFAAVVVGKAAQRFGEK